MQEKWRVGIAGYGDRGSHFAKDVWPFVNSPAQVVAVADPNPEARDRARIDIGCEVFEDVEDMLVNVDLNILIVATHVSLHFDVATIGILYGCHVVCEKPMAETLARCDGMIQLAQRAGVALAVHHQSTLSRATAETIRLIRAGAIGDLVSMAAYGKGRIACSDLVEIGGHLTDWMRKVFLATGGGDMVDVFGHVTYKGHPITKSDRIWIKLLYPEGRDSGYGAGDRIFGGYTSANGVYAELHLNELSGASSTYAEQRAMGYYMDVYGTAGRLRCFLPRVLYLNRSPLDDRTYGRPTEWEEVNPAFREDREHVLSRILAEDFLRAIEEKRKPVASAEDGRMAIEMTLAGIYASHFAGRPLPVPLQDRGDPFRTVSGE